MAIGKLQFGSIRVGVGQPRAGVLTERYSLSIWATRMRWRNVELFHARPSKLFVRSILN